MSGVQDRSLLVLAAQGGDPLAIARLLAACQPDARRYARRHCLASDIDDAVQEGLLIVARRVGGLKAVLAFSGWLFTVIQRECQRLARAALRMQSLDEQQAEAWLAQHSDEALRLDLIAALESLPAHYREVILLRDFEELSMGEVAARIGDTVAAAKSRLHRARALVREYLLVPD
ncbi:RNA polymerase sigma factor, sigma-70 family [Andreprevotia lacus DSM 23236]|jgi:RNA polymerase sigma factor (sigma-70 family)|uniref:RNA polymerase sigma factor, sigma-70 family n=1 Tax=Andreprevotia lacus DSM 23236 TaxID=1121001 RepID=A0A1W1XEI7_9NEIS|nr:sigma-70 family RNA polymerase sigma factor [Andreprevotia lacus]SMC22297.1 RNA polymerase sigma factor, sigma-70 family [Andreprevotia lacus DSM 23236]